MAEHADVLIAEHRLVRARLGSNWSQRANAGGPVGAAVAVAVGASLAGGRRCQSTYSATPTAIAAPAASQRSNGRRAINPGAAAGARRSHPRL
jgi:hypothetical protein